MTSAFRRSSARVVFAGATFGLLCMAPAWSSDCGLSCEDDTPHPFFDAGGDAFVIVSHEGDTSQDGEITLDGFIRAREAGALIMETNLVLKDGVLRASHSSSPSDKAPTVTELLGDPELADVRWMFEFNDPVAGLRALQDVIGTGGTMRDRVCVQFGTAWGAEVDDAHDYLDESMPSQCVCASVIDRIRNSDLALARLVAQHQWFEDDHRADCSVLDAGFVDDRDAFDYPEGVTRLVWFIRPARPTVEEILEVVRTCVDGVITDDVASAVTARELFEMSGDADECG